MADPTTQDFVKTQDLTGATTIGASQINQMIDTAVPATDKGLILVTQDSAAGVAVVPNPATAYIGETPSRWTRYIWKRRSYGDATAVILYYWDEYATADGTYLKWVRIDAGSVAALAKAEEAYTKAEEAEDTADSAIDDATTALNNSNTALTNASSANTTADSALAIAQALVESTYIGGTVTGTNSYALDTSLTPAAAGQVYILAFTNANTGAATLQVKSGAIKPILRFGNAALAGGEIGAGSYHILYETLTNYIIMSIPSDTVIASDIKVIQTVVQRITTPTVITTLLPADGSIPQISEGDLFMTQAFVPKKSTSRLLIEFECPVAPVTSVGGCYAIAALFQNAGLDAIAAGAVFQDYASTAGFIQTLRFTLDVASASTSSRSYTVRIGMGGAAPVSVHVNELDATGTNTLGGTMLATTLKITEYVS